MRCTSNNCKREVEDSKFKLCLKCRIYKRQHNKMRRLKYPEQFRKYCVICKCRSIIGANYCWKCGTKF